MLGLNGRHNTQLDLCGTGMYAGEIYIRGEVPEKHRADNSKTELLHGEADLGHLALSAAIRSPFSYDMDYILAEPSPA